MNLETIKEITSTINSLGGDATEAFTWYLIYNLIETVAGYLAWFSCLSVVAGTVYSLIKMSICGPARVSEGRAVTLLKELRDRAGIGAPGVITGTEFTILRGNLFKLLDDQRKNK